MCGFRPSSFVVRYARIRRNKEAKMRLVTYSDGNGTHVGALHGDGVVALDSVAPDMLS